LLFSRCALKRTNLEVLLVDHPLPWLRYVDAGKITAPGLALDGMKVRNDAMETLGNVDGFIVDNSSKRPYYVVVDSGGWFKSKDFLVPIGHARIDDDNDALIVNLPKSRIERFPGFDLSQFERLTEDDIRTMNNAICEACSETPVLYTPTDPLSNAWGRPEFTQPDWWATVTRLDTTADVSAGDTAFVPTEDYPATKVARATGELQAEEMLDENRKAGKRTERKVAREADRDSERELVTAREGDTSPYFDGRAQPGDVLGLETGGEQTHVGETSEDENKRRIDAERDAAKRRD
jgi:hypothetical protein